MWKETWTVKKMSFSGKYIAKMFSLKKFLLGECISKLVSSKHIYVESELKQRWLSTFINVVSTLIFGWKWKLSQRIFIDAVSMLAKQRWNNVNRITSIQRRWTNVIFQRFKFGWKWKLSRRIFMDVVSTLTKQRWSNIESIMSIQCWWPNVISTFIFGWKWKLSQRVFIVVASTLRKQHWKNFVNICCTDKNKIKFSSMKHIFLLHKNIINYCFICNQMIVLDRTCTKYQ